MKKLMMFAAAMTIVGGAYAGCGDPAEVTNDCALAYNVKVAIKTTVGKPIAGSIYASHCGDAVTNDTVCYRTTAKVSLKGLLTTCFCECDDFMDNTLVLWDTKAKTYELSAGTLAFQILNIFGKKSNEVEGFGAIPMMGDGKLGAGVLYVAGFGKWDVKAGRVSSMSGNVAGMLEAPECDSSITCDAAIAYPCTDLDNADEIETAASGTWSISYSSSLSKKLMQDQDSLPYPDYL